jgi:hypothetical protein
MPKTDDTFDPTDYTPVAERVTQFYARYPHGRIVTRLVKESARRVLFEARVYRSPDEPRPAATGWAAERPGDGMINTVACVENTETSAIGRALANLGILAGRQRPSREEMEKARRARTLVSLRSASPAPYGGPHLHRERAESSAPLTTPDDLNDLEELLSSAESRGWGAERASQVRSLILRGRGSIDDAGRAVPPEPIALETTERLVRELQDWLQLNDRAT